MKKTRRILVVLLALVMCLGIMPLVIEAEEAEPVTLDWLWFADGAETEAAQKIIDLYIEANPHVTINLIETPYDDMQKSVNTAVTGGKPPALARTTEGIVGNTLPALVNLGDYMDKDEILEQYVESVHNFMVYDDQLLAIQTDVTANGMIYNKTAFEQAGVEAPLTPEDVWTWDEFAENIQTVVENSDVRYGLVIDNPVHRWSTILYEFGGHYIGDEGQADFDTPEALEAVNFTKMLFDEGIVPHSTWLGGENPNDLFRSGQVAVHLSGNWMLTNYEENIEDFEWGVMYLPMAANRSSVPGGKQIVAFKDTGVEDEAVKFIEFFTNQENNASYVRDSLFISARFDNAQVDYPFGSEHFEVFANELANTVPDTSRDLGYPNFSAIQTTRREGLLAVIADEMSAEDYLAEVQAELEEIVADAQAE